MLDRCRQKCVDLNLKTGLFKQSMQELDLPDKFGLIFIPDGTIAFATTDRELELIFQKVHGHLLPEGSFMFDVYSSKGRQQAKKEGVWTGDWKRTKDNVIYAKRIMVNYNTKTNTREALLIIDKFENGQLVASEENLGFVRYFTTDELFPLLDKVGFVDIKANDRLSEEPARGDSEMMTIMCRRPN